VTIPADRDTAALTSRDRTTLDFLQDHNTRLRSVLCTLARRGVAIRQDEPDRAGQILDALAPWPFYKGGQFLFDLLEWEDFMLDGDPPPVRTRAELASLLDLPGQWLGGTARALRTPAVTSMQHTSTALNLPMRWLAATARSTLNGVLQDVTEALQPRNETASPGSADDQQLPPLQSGFYLYQDVMLGLFDLMGPYLTGTQTARELPGQPPNQSGSDGEHEEEREEGSSAMTVQQESATTGPAVSTDVFPIRETFRVTDPKDLNHDWSLLGDATLTGDDGLRLTPNERNKAGTALLNTPFPSKAGVSIEFDYYSSGGNGDGFAVYLIDGAYSTQVGGYGAGLGYARGPRGESNGVTKGYLGIGFDSWGNYSTHLAGPTGDDTSHPNTIGLRGSGDKDSGFAYVTGAKIDNGLNAVWEDQAHVQVVIVDAVVTVLLTRKGTTTTVLDGVDLKLAQGQAALPDTFKLGLSASTGYEISWHRMRNLDIAMPAEMPLSLTGPDEVPAGSAVSYSIKVHNNGPNDVPDAKVTGTLDPALSAVSVTVSATEGGATAGAGQADATTFTQPLSLPVGGSATITVTGTTDRAATGSVTCTATIESPQYSNTATDKSGAHTTRLTAHVPQDNLLVCQQGTATVKPGGAGFIAISVANPDNNTIDLATAELVFDTPTGFEWSGTVTFTYYNATGQSRGSGPVELSPKLENGNRRLRLTGLQDVKSTDGYVLSYALGIKARQDAKPGRFTDGSAVVADSVPLRLTSTVEGTEKKENFGNDDSALPVLQPALLETKQGEAGFMAVTIGFQKDTKQELAGMKQEFQAPTGFRWNGFLSYSYYSGGKSTQGSEGDIKYQITENGSTLKITGMPPLKATKGLYLTYVLGLTADANAQLGEHADGQARIGDARPLTLHASVLDKSEPAKCNR
jgi:uncharacterized repeat protein (TIGR01451 family)